MLFTNCFSVLTCPQAIGPKADKWRTKGFPLYDDILTIVDGIIATRQNAFHAGCKLAESSFEIDTGDDPDGTDDDIEVGVFVRVWYNPWIDEVSVEYRGLTSGLI